MSPAQRKIINEMLAGRKLSALLSTAPGFGNGKMPFNASLEGQSKRPNIATVKAMLDQGLIEEAQRRLVSKNEANASLWCVEYQTKKA